MGGACWWLKPLHERLAAHVFTSAKLFADDTTLPVLDPGRGRTKTGRLWVYARDDRPWAGTDPPAAVYLYSPDRKSERPASHLKNFRGILQVDGYAGFERLTADGSIALAACWALARRKFFEVSEATGSPIAAEALRRIAEIYVETQLSFHPRTIGALDPGNFAYVNAKSTNNIQCSTPMQELYRRSKRSPFTRHAN